MRTRTTIALISASFALWTLIFALGLGLNFRPVKPNLVAVVLIQVGVIGDFLTVITAVLLGAWINWKDERPLAGAGESAAGGKGGAGGVV